MSRRAGGVVAVVDDDEAVRESLRFLLETEGLEVETYPSAGEFLTEARGQGFGCLVVDYQMPEITGLDLVDELRTHGSNVPAILITALPSQAILERAVRLGVLKVLEKPLADDTLVDTVLGAMRHAEAG